MIFIFEMEGKEWKKQGSRLYTGNSSLSYLLRKGLNAITSPITFSDRIEASEFKGGREDEYARH